MITRKLYTFLFSLYFGISSIYWLPFINEKDLRIIKLSFFGVLVFLTIIQGGKLKNFDFIRGIFGPFGLLFLLFSHLFSSLFVEKSRIWDTAVDVFTFYLSMWMFGLLIINKLLVVEKVLKISFLILSVFILFHIITVLLKMEVSIPDVNNSFESFKDIGFNLSRTGWSNGLSLYVPIGLFFFKDYKKWIPVLLIVYSQYLCGGRAGLSASLLIIYSYIYRGKVSWSLFFFFVILLSVFTFYIEDFAEVLRIDRIESGVNASTLDDFSANRIVGFRYGIERWLESPFFGAGYINVSYEGVILEGMDIHNFWIKMLAEYGIIPIIFYLIFVFQIVRSASQFKLRGKDSRIVFLVLVGGLFTTMFEPNAIFGSFQNSAIWWFCAAIVLVEQKNK